MSLTAYDMLQGSKILAFRGVHEFFFVSEFVSSLEDLQSMPIPITTVGHLKHPSRGEKRASG